LPDVSSPSFGFSEVDGLEPFTERLEAEMAVVRKFHNIRGSAEGDPCTHFIYRPATNEAVNCCGA
jgi:hypothetical protein